MKTRKLGGWIIDPSSNVLKNGGEVRHLSPKSMDVLNYLLQRRGEVVSKDEIISEVWQDQYISEQVINNAIWSIRKALDDNARSPRFLETIPKRGYRLLEPDRPLSFRSADSTRLTAGWLKTLKTAAGHWTWLAAVVLVAAVGVQVVIFLLPSPAAFGDEGILGPKLRPVTSLPGTEEFPSLSPDGSQIAFSWNGGQGSEKHLYLHSLDSTIPSQLTFGPFIDRLAAWSPGGRRLAFHRQDAEGRSGIYSIPVLGGEPELLVEKPGLAICPYSVDYSPDGDWLAFAAFDLEKGTARLFLHSLADNRSRAIVTVQMPTFDSWPRFSPDSRFLAFMRMEGSMRSLLVWDLAQESLQSVLTGRGDLRGLDWKPDGRHLLFSDSDGIKQVAVAGGNPQLIVAGPDIHQITTSARSARLVFEQRRQIVDIFEKAIEESPEKVAAPEVNPGSSLIASTWADTQPALSPDGRRIAFISNRSGSYQLWAARRDGSHPVQVTDWEGLRPQHPAWAADGNSLVFESYMDGSSDIYQVSLSGDAPRRLTYSEGSEIQPSFSPIANHLYYCSVQEKTRSIRRLDLESGRDQLLIEGGSRPIESPDGRWLYYLREGEVRRRPASGGPEMAVTDGFQGVTHTWLPYGEGLLVQRLTDDGWEILLLSPDDDREELIHREATSRCDFHFASGGRSLLFPHFTDHTGDLMLLENF
ncbi:MAG TPA: winged helix-turn-helix domain-containing protein [Acidobacteriota bacterium]|nr:winged helix-turn-helix domain-containing protein [Acidobacteriota bacterium]